MRKRRSEANAITKHLHEWKKEEWVWLYKIPDEWYAKKPFDVIWVIKWVPTAIEYKFCDLKTKLPDVKRAYKKLEPHQVINLDKFQKAWGKSYVIVYHNETRQYIKLDFNLFYEEVWDEIKKLYIMLNNNVRMITWSKNECWK